MSAGFNNTFGNDVAFHNAAEDIDQDNFDFRLSQHDFKSRRNFFRRSSSSDIKEVIRLTAEQFDRVHGRHCETGAVNQTRDITVELNVLETCFVCTKLRRIFLLRVVKFFEFRVTQQRVVIKSHLHVQRINLFVGCYDQGIDFQ